MKTYKMKINTEDYTARILEYDGITAKVEVNGVDFFVEIDNEAIAKSPKLYRSKRDLPTTQKFSGPKDTEIDAPIPGIIVSINVKEGDHVKAGDVLILLEAMKMESEIHATFSGTISSVVVKQNDTVQEGQKLLEIQPDEEAVARKEHRRKSDAVKPKVSPKPTKKVAAGGKIVKSPLPGTVFKIEAKEGDQIAEDQTVIILEAMKMESDITSDFAGKLKKIFVNQGDSVQEGQDLFEIE